MEIENLLQEHRKFLIGLGIPIVLIFYNIFLYLFLIMIIVYVSIVGYKFVMLTIAVIEKWGK